MAPTTYTPPINTYVPLESIVLTNAASSVTFFNIAQSDDSGTYKDLVLVCNGTTSAGQGIYLYLNNDTTAGNYSRVVMYGDGTSYASGAASDAKSLDFYTSPTVTTTNIMDYSATDKHTTILNRVNAASSIVEAVAARWANTAAVTSVKVQTTTGTFSIGSTFSLYALHG